MWCSGSSISQDRAAHDHAHDLAVAGGAEGLAVAQDGLHRVEAVGGVHPRARLVGLDRAQADRVHRRLVAQADELRVGRGVALGAHGPVELLERIALGGGRTDRLVVHGIAPVVRRRLAPDDSPTCPKVTPMSGSAHGSPDERPVALVTASCRGPGLDRLHELCRVHYDPWIDHRPLRIWDGRQLAERVDELGATVLVCEADFVQRRGAGAPAGGHRLDPGRPHQRRRGRRHRPGHPGAAHAGPQRRWRGRADRRPAAGRHPPRGARRSRRARRRGLPRRLHPLPAVPGLADRRAHRRAGRPRAPSAGPCAGASRAWA